jgi:hypothetical protein
MHTVGRWGLWISTIIIVLLAALQGLSGHWAVFFNFWGGGPALSSGVARFIVWLGSYHREAGFAVGGLSVVVLVFSFLTKSSIYVRALAVLGFALTVLTAEGGYKYVTSGFQDRWSLGQMADAFVGVFGVYFIQLFFMNKTPRFPWSKQPAK